MTVAVGKTPPEPPKTSMADALRAEAAMEPDAVHTGPVK